MTKAKEFKKWYSERQGHPPQIKAALAAIIELEIEIESLKDKPKTKSITLTNGSKYSYTESIGDHMASYGFDTHKELIDFVLSQRKYDKVWIGKPDPTIKE